MAVILGCNMLKHLCKRLGIEGPVRRLVLDIPYDGVVMAHVERLATMTPDDLDEVLREATIVERSKIAIDGFGHVVT